MTAFILCVYLSLAVAATLCFRGANQYFALSRNIDGARSVSARTTAVNMRQTGVWIVVSGAIMALVGLFVAII